jgi:hypothetical protein
MADKKQKPVCSECSSDAVLSDAWASWNSEEQKWELSSTFDAAHCEDCDGETSLEWVDVEEEAQ